MLRLLPFPIFICIYLFSWWSCKKAGEVVGQGTGDLYDHLENLKNSKVSIYVSGLSAKSRGYDEKLLDGFTAEFVMPDVLVEESIKADSVLCY